MMVTHEEGTANYVPAAAVIRRIRAVSGVLGGKKLRRWHIKSGVKSGGATFQTLS